MDKNNLTDGGNIIERVDKIQCQICGEWFRQVGSHVTQAHGYKLARDYRKDFGFDVKKGQLPKDLKELKSKQCRENGTIKNLEQGIKYIWKDKKDIPKYKRSIQTLERIRRIRNMKEDIRIDSLGKIYGLWRMK